MTNFHRKGTPSYFGGLPAGYDYINKPTDVTVGGTGAAAFAAGKKVGGPNDGTYYVAFGEDATSSDANRPADALATNTDYLDDLLHRDLALTVRTSDVTAGGAVASVVIAGQVFVGASGTPNTADQRNRLISVLDGNDNEIIDSSGATVVASLIHDGSSTNVVGTQASGFYSGPTVNFTPSIPAGTTYRIYYGQRSNLATLPLSAFTDIIIRNAQEVDGGVESQLRNLHAPGNLQAWDAPWDSTIRALAASGLNERYRRATGVPGSFAFDTPGNGSIIIRDGRAVEIRGYTNTLGTSTPPDKNFALLRLVADTATSVGGSWPNDAKGGDTGIWHETDLNGSNTASEISRLGRSGPALLDVVPRSYTSGTLTTQAFTYINPASTATLNPTSGSDSSSRRKVQCGAGEYFRIPSGGDANKTAVRLGVDMLEVTVAGVTQTYVITDLVGTNAALVVYVTGRNADFGATATSATIRFVQPSVSIGGSAATFTYFPYLPSALFAPPPPTQVGGDSPFSRIMPPAFYAASNGQHEPPSGVFDMDITAAHWGYFDNTSGQLLPVGQLRGDGQIRTPRGAWTLSVGDGVNSFGDFNGVTALVDALSFMDAKFGAHNWSARIYVKRGNYNINQGSDNPIVADSGQEIIIHGDGVGSGGTSIFNASAGAGSLAKVGNGRLVFEDVRLVSTNDGALELGTDTSSSPYLELNRCTVYGPVKVSRAPNYISDSNGRSLYAYKTSFQTGNGTHSLVWVAPTGGAIKLERLCFEDCRIEAPVNHSVVRIDPIASQAIFIEDIQFFRCDIKLNGQTTTLCNETDPLAAPATVANSGVLHINGNSGGTAYAPSQIKGVRFENCNVFATGARPLLMYAQFSSRFKCVSFEVEGGRWIVDSTTTVIDANPFSVVPLALTYEFGTVRGYDLLPVSTGGNEPIMKFSMKNTKIGYGSDGATPWAGSSLYAGHYGAATSFQDLGVSPTVSWGAIVVRAGVIDVQDIEFVGAVRKSNLPDLEVYGVDEVRVARFKVLNMATTLGSGSVFPRARLSVVVGGLSGRAHIDEVDMNAFGAAVTDSGRPLMGISHATSSTTSGAPGYLIHFDKCGLGQNGAVQGRGITWVGGPAGATQYLRVRITNCDIYGHVGSGIMFADPIPKYLHISGNTIRLNQVYGVWVECQTWGLDRDVTIEGNVITDNTSTGILCQADTAWEISGTLGNNGALVAGPSILNNHVYGNDSGNMQITIGTTSIDHPGGVVVGNNCHGQSIRVLTPPTTGYIYTIGLQPIRSGDIPSAYPWVRGTSVPADFVPLGQNRAVFRQS